MSRNSTRREFLQATARAGGALGVAGSATGILGALGCAPGGGDSSGGGPGQEMGSGAGAVAPRRILILGGTRFIGPHQVKYALDRGHEVSIFTRGRTAPPFYHDYFERVEQLIGDRNDDLTALEGREWDTVIDNSASYPRWVDMTTALLRGSVGQYLFVSSISAYADFAQAGISEDYPVGQLSAPDVEDMSEYGPMKAKCEQLVRDAFAERAIIVRPGLIVGPGDNTDRWTYWPVRVARGGEVLAPNSPDDPVQNIDARDLSQWIVRFAEATGGGTYNATGEVETFGGMLDEVRAAVDSDATFTWVPAGFMERNEVAAWMHMTNWVPPSGGTVGLNQVSVAAAVRAGLTFRPVGETARDTLEWWNALPEDRRAAPRAGLPAEKEAEVLAAWRSSGRALHDVVEQEQVREKRPQVSRGVQVVD